MTSSALNARTQSLTVRDVAAACDVAPSAVRYYEAHGLVRAQRTTGNQRRFDESAACRIRFGRLALKAGLTVREVSTVLQSLPDEPSQLDWARVGDALVRAAQARFEKFRDDLDGLQATTTVCMSSAGSPETGTACG